MALIVLKKDFCPVRTVLFATVWHGKQGRRCFVWGWIPICSLTYVERWDPSLTLASYFVEVLRSVVSNCVVLKRNLLCIVANRDYPSAFTLYCTVLVIF